MDGEAEAPASPSRRLPDDFAEMLRASPHYSEPGGVPRERRDSLPYFCFLVLRTLVRQTTAIDASEAAAAAASREIEAAASKKAREEHRTSLHVDQFPIEFVRRLNNDEDPSMADLWKRDDGRIELEDACESECSLPPLSFVDEDATPSPPAADLRPFGDVVGEIMSELTVDASCIIGERSIARADAEQRRARRTNSAPALHDTQQQQQHRSRRKNRKTFHYEIGALFNPAPREACLKIYLIWNHRSRAAGPRTGYAYAISNHFVDAKVAFQPIVVSGYPRFWDVYFIDGTVYWVRRQAPRSAQFDTSKELRTLDLVRAERERPGSHGADAIRSFSID